MIRWVGGVYSEMEEKQIASELFAACDSGDVDGLVGLLHREPYSVTLLQRTKDASSSLAKETSERTIYVACSKGHIDVVKYLLRAGVDPNVNSGSGTPIYAAAKVGHLDLVKLLVEYGADYKNAQGSFSPLCVACTQGKLNVIKYLISRGANPHAFDNPPLVFTACAAGYLDVVKYFIEELQYDINRTSGGVHALKTDGKDTLLQLACQMNREDIAMYLYEKGAAITKSITTQFVEMITTLIQSNFKPVDQGFYHARLNEMGLVETPWPFFASYSSVLTKIELRTNSLSSLPTELFQMPSLTDLDVSHNHLTAICGEDVIWECSKLGELNASHNNLTCVSAAIFALPNLLKLHLSHNKLQSLPGEPQSHTQSEDPSKNAATWSCTSLKTFDVSYNLLPSLPDCFEALRNVTMVMVSNNVLHELPCSLPEGCIALSHLDASYNQLTDLPTGSPKYWMNTLEKLDLSNNRITEISKNITQLSHLTTLDLSRNMIETLPPTSYWTGSRLKALDLSNNQLTSLTLLEPRNTMELGNTMEPQNTMEQKDPKELNSSKRASGGEMLFRTRSSALSNHIAPPVLAKVQQPRELPVSQWSSTLQSLKIQNNKLTTLPDYISSFGSLASLDISGNTDIKTLPKKLGLLTHCTELITSGLSISNVPQHLLPGVSRGGSTKHVLAYLRSQLRNCVPNNRMKLMVVGLQGRGKTTLLSVLRDPTAPLPENISTVGVNVADWVVKAPPEVVRRFKGVVAREVMDVVFSTWDMAGQEVYYATHQCFLSRNTLYLVVWNMEEGEKGIHHLQPWLLNIQSRAPSSPVIIVGTHLDKIPSKTAKDHKEQYRQMIKTIYDRSGFPAVSNIMFVSAVTKEGIKDLQEKIYSTAIFANASGTRELIIGKQVPLSYLRFQEVISEEVIQYRTNGQPAILNQKEFAALAQRIPNNDVLDLEELSVATQFLHDNGVLLHYNDQLKGLSNLYFIDPIWLANMLAEIITVPQRQTFVHKGILKESDVPFIFRDTNQFPVKFHKQYLQLMERYEIALSLGKGQYLIPSMLPLERPSLSLPITIPKHITYQEVSAEDMASPANEGEGQYPVVMEPVECIRRRYKMAYIPSGFWSRLISRLLINLKRSGIAEDDSIQKMNYWRRGLMVSYDTGGFLVESLTPPSAEIAGVGVGRVLDRSNTMVTDGFETIDSHGVDITVWTDTEDFSAMGYIVDQLDSLINEWFPGLHDVDGDGRWLVQHQVLWTVPLSHTMRRSSDRAQDIRRASQEHTTVCMVCLLEFCCAWALSSDYIIIRKINVRVPLAHMIPDVLMMDLPRELKVQHNRFQFDPSPTNCLGQGGYGSVFRGCYNGDQVAIKLFVDQIQVARELNALQTGFATLEPRKVLGNLRQEVTVLAQLSHPNIVALLGVSIRPLCIMLEFAPMGNMSRIIEIRVEEWRAKQVDSASTILRMPGGVLGHVMTTKIAMQVAIALQFVHNIGIIYRDLKSDNVLVWSVDPKDKVNIKLADYGISRFANPGGVKGMEGTPGYQAPETILRKGEQQAFDEKVDIFSFAMLLYELLSGLRPFHALESPQGKNTLICKGERPSLSHGNVEPSFAGMVDLMMDCWSQSPSERPAAHEIVALMSQPDFFCRRDTIRRWKGQPLHKVDAMHSSTSPKTSPQSNGCEVWMWARQDNERQLAVLDVGKGTFRRAAMTLPGGRARATAVLHHGDSIRVWVSTVHGNEVHIYGLDPAAEPKRLWDFKMHHTVLSLLLEVKEDKVTRVFAALVKGALCIFSTKSSSGLKWHTGDALPEDCHTILHDQAYATEADDWSNPVFLRLDVPTKPVKCMTFVGGDYLWCGCGNGIVAVDIVNMKVIKQIPVFVKNAALVSELVSDGSAVWGVGLHLSCVLQWDVKTYTLVSVFDCSNVDPTGLVVTTDPREFENIFDPEQAQMASMLPDSVWEAEGSKGLNVINEPEYVISKLSKSFRRWKSSPTSIGLLSLSRRASLSTTRVPLSLQRSTHTTSLAVVDRTLWVGRGMGDIIVLDISRGPAHGKVLARLATEGCEKYGNKSHHKLVMVAGEYVVSSQWLEPIDMNKDQTSENSAHQEVTIWEAWGHRQLEEYSTLRDILVHPGV